MTKRKKNQACRVASKKKKNDPSIKVRCFIADAMKVVAKVQNDNNKVLKKKKR